MRHPVREFTLMYSSIILVPAQHRNLVVLILALSSLLQAAQSSSPLSIQVIEGQNAINSVSRSSAFEPVVEVQSDGKPVAGASVTFILPSVGPGASFTDGSKTRMVQTDAEGRAGARG